MPLCVVLGPVQSHNQCFHSTVTHHRPFSWYWVGQGGGVSASPPHLLAFPTCATLCLTGAPSFRTMAWHHSHHIFLPCCGLLGVSCQHPAFPVDDLVRWLFWPPFYPILQSWKEMGLNSRTGPLELTAGGERSARHQCLLASLSVSGLGGQKHMFLAIPSTLHPHTKDTPKRVYLLYPPKDS